MVERPILSLPFGSKATMVSFSLCYPKDELASLHWINSAIQLVNNHYISHEPESSAETPVISHQLTTIRHH